MYKKGVLGDRGRVYSNCYFSHEINWGSGQSILGWCHIKVIHVDSTCHMTFLCVFWAHHEGLRRLKSCQYWRKIYWHCEIGNIVGLLISIGWQCVVHGQGAIRANVPGLASCTLLFGKFDQKQKAFGCFLEQIGSLVWDL